MWREWPCAGAWREAYDPIPTVRGGLGRLASFLGDALYAFSGRGAPRPSEPMSPVCPTAEHLSRGCQKALEGLFARKNGQVAAGEDLLIVFGKGHLNDGVVFVLAEDDADGGIFVR